MKSLDRYMLAGTVAFALAASAGYAHHGWSGYDEGNTLNLTGTIQSSTYENPHGTMKLTVQGDTSKTWDVVLAPPSRMDSRGLSRSMLDKGTTATVVGYPHEDQDDEMRAERITISGKTVELR